MYSNVGFVQIYRKLIYDTQFLKLKNKPSKILLCLIAYHNQFQNDVFFLKKKEFYQLFNISRVTLWRYAKQLQKFGVNISLMKTKLVIDMTEYSKKYITHSETILLTQTETDNYE